MSAGAQSFDDESRRELEIVDRRDDGRRESDRCH